MKNNVLVSSLTILSLILVLSFLLLGWPGSVDAQEPPDGDVSALVSDLGAAFTYQGHLQDGGNPAIGTYDFEFKLYDSATNGTEVGGSTLTKDGITVTNGFFTVTLDFGGGVFMGDARWLQIGVRAGGSADAYTILSPRQALTPVPYAFGLRPGATISGSDRALTLTSVNDNGLYASSNGISRDGAALQLRNTNNAGIGIWSYTASSDAAIVIENFGSGPFIKGFGNNGGDHEFQIGNDGSITSGKIFAQNNEPFLPGATIEARNNNSDGVAVRADTISSDATLVVGNNGSGPLIKGFGNNGGEHEFQVDNDGTVITTRLQITGGSDLSEQFDIRASEANPKPSPGMVVSIDSEHPGELVVSSRAYDRTVAGVVSGAGGVSTGMVMGQSGSMADGKYPVALTGRVYVWADASYGPIQPGDLLTTADTPGHAMKVTDYERAHGAILGKAMSSLEEGKGLVLVLVSLQ